MSIYLLYGALILYLASTSFYLFILITNKTKMEKAAHYLLVFGCSVHLLSLIARYFQAGYAPITNLHESLSFLAFCIAGFFLYLKKNYKVQSMGVIILPLLSLLLILSLANPAEIKPLPPALNSWWLPVHTVFAFLGNAIFVVAFFVSIFYLIVERAIKKKKRLTFSERLPSLDTLDRVNYRCMSCGFPFLTIGIISGSIWAGLAWESYWSWDPKETWSLITWIVYAILIHNRLTIGWRGRKTAYMMILGFLFILFTFLGVNFLIKGLHSYV